MLVRQSITVSGADGIALTKLDVLDGFDEIKICTGYKLDGKTLDYLPASVKDQAACEPIYETDRRLEEDHARGAHLARSAGQGDQVRPPHRGADRLPGLVSTSPERDDTS